MNRGGHSKFRITQSVVALTVEEFWHHSASIKSKGVEELNQAWERWQD